ncbi:MAG TPA: cytochrome P450 [Pseudolabrys sp.]|nr:cytochrome P450 [Pseudolabrys sp.]
MLDFPAELNPPVPLPRTHALGPIELLRVLAKNPLEAWTSDHFEQPIVMSGLPIGRVAVVNDPAAIRRVLLENRDNYQKDWLQRRVLSAGLTEGLLTAEDHQWRMQRRALAPLFSRKTVMNFSAAMVEVANGLVVRLAEREGETVDIAIEATRITLEVLERTIFSDGLGRAPEDIRLAMKKYFETIGRIDPFDMLGIPGFVPRPWRWRLAPMLRLFETAIDSIVSTRRERIAKNPAGAPRDILTLLLEATDPETGEALSETEIRANILTFIAAGHETTANCISWSLYLLSQSPPWRERVQAEADREFDDQTDSLADRLVETRAVIDESNRLYPPIGAISREAIGPDELAGELIKPGTMVVVAPYVLHRHHMLWAKPARFDPNRFLGRAREMIDRFSYLPFGVGPRICIGATFAIQEASIVVAAIMRHFTLEMTPGHPVWPVLRVTLRPKDGLPMMIRRRQAQSVHSRSIKS